MAKLVKRTDTASATADEIATSLEHDIRAGKYADGVSFPSLSAIVRAFRVSRPTAVRVVDELRRRGMVSVRRGSGTYVTYRADARRIGLIMPGVARSEFFRPILNALSRLSRANNCTLMFGDVFSGSPAARIAEARELAATFVRKRVAGVVYQPLETAADNGEANRRILSVFNRAKIPVVLLDSDVVPSPARSDCDLVSIDNVRAGERLAAHLVERGARRIVYLMRPDWVPNVLERFRGVRLASAEATAVRAEPNDLEAVRAALRRRPDAFVCENDTTAAILCQTLARLGCSVPRDVMLAGFDDVQVARIMTPRLTTMRQPCEALARVAFERLAYRISKPSAPAVEMLLDAELVVRESTCRRPSGQNVKRKDKKK